MITEEEKGYIRISYRDAKDKYHQVTIESQVHTTTRENICEILGIELNVRGKQDRKRMLYDLGWDDIRIAAYLRLAPHTILDWRRRNGLAQAGKPVVYVDKPKRDALFLECYNSGMSDGQIAHKVGCSKSAANAWRVRNKLPCVYLKHGNN